MELEVDDQTISMSLCFPNLFQSEKKVNKDIMFPTFNVYNIHPKTHEYYIEIKQEIIIWMLIEGLRELAGLI